MGLIYSETYVAYFFVTKVFFEMQNKTNDEC